MTAFDLISAERERQVAKGYDAEHDDGHRDASLAAMAAGVLARYADCGSIGLYRDDQKNIGRQIDRINAQWRGQSLRLLTISAALVVAEIERIQRAGQTVATEL